MVKGVDEEKVSADSALTANRGTAAGKVSGRDRLAHGPGAGGGKRLAFAAQVLHLFGYQQTELPVSFLFRRAVTHSAPGEKVRAVPYI